MTSGARNLLLLGVFSLLIALATSGVSLALYHSSGDIYLDRSRPGYLPDEEEIEEYQSTHEEDYSFSSTTRIDADTLDEYLDHYSATVESLNSLKDPFSATPLSDESLGFPAK
ncbi:hypothetical protein IJI02_00010 [Candidatus Saccharibacteria bacterium]|nr:hypothetical protein [Candidatus Saccharibacteria bacterium]